MSPGQDARRVERPALRLSQTLMVPFQRAASTWRPPAIAWPARDTVGQVVVS